MKQNMPTGEHSASQPSLTLLHATAAFASQHRFLPCNFPLVLVGVRQQTAATVLLCLERLPRTTAGLQAAGVGPLSLGPDPPTDGRAAPEAPHGRQNEALAVMDFDCAGLLGLGEPCRCSSSGTVPSGMF